MYIIWTGRACNKNLKCRQNVRAKPLLLRHIQILDCQKTIIVSYPDPPISAALGVLHHKHAERKGLETLARFSCALEEFAQSQWGARCHVTDRTLVRNV